MCAVSLLGEQHLPGIYPRLRTTKPSFDQLLLEACYSAKPKVKHLPSAKATRNKKQLPAPGMVNLLPTMPVSHRGTGSSPGSYTSNPAPCTHVGGIKEAPGFNLA